MGLDVTAYSKLKKVPKNKWSRYSKDTLFDVAWNNEWGIFYMIPELKEYADDVEAYIPYEYEDELYLRAGSYSGYRQWTEMLKEIATTIGYDVNKPDSPFQPFLSYDAVEGVVGATHAKLFFMDFIKNRQLAHTYARMHFGAEAQWFSEKYDEWMNVCELAADGGAIQYH